MVFVIALWFVVRNRRSSLRDLDVRALGMTATSFFQIPVNHGYLPENIALAFLIPEGSAVEMMVRIVDQESS